MDPRRWTRNAAFVKERLFETKDGTVVAKSQMAIYIPERYVEKRLAVIADETYILGIFAIVAEDKHYSVSNALAMMRVKPSMITTVKFNKESYLELRFDPGSVVIADTNLVRDDVLVYRVFDEFISKGRIPWFMDYRRDMGALFASAGHHAGVQLGNNHVILDVITAAIVRDAADNVVYYRQRLKSPSDLDKVEPVCVPLKSVSLGATNTTSKLVGSYFGEGLTSALVNPSETTERIETILRQ